MRRGGDPWSVHALKNTRMKHNQRIINILYRIQISLKWELSLNAHLLYIEIILLYPFIAV